MMKYLLSIFFFGILASSGFSQTMKSLMYNTTNGQVVANTGTNVLTFTNTVNLNGGISESGVLIWDSVNNEFYAGATFHGEIAFGGTNASGFAAATRTNLGLGATNNVVFNNITANNNLVVSNSLTTYGYSEFNDGILINYGIDFGSTNIAAAVRTNLGFSTNLNTLWIATNTIAARQALGLQSYTNSLTNSVNDVEIGSTVNSITIGWTISPTNATYAVRQLVGAGQTNTITNNSSTLALTSLGLTNATIWTLTVGDGAGVTNTATTSVNFYNYMTWGRSTNTSLDNSQIQSLHTTGGGANRALSTSRSRSITMDGGGQYLYIAYPQGFGAASFVVGGLPNSAFTAFTNSYTNANGYVTNYLIYRTDTIQNGTGINIVVQ